MGGVDDQQVHPGVDQRQRPLEALVADSRGSRDAQAPLIVLDGVGIELGLLDILDGDEACAAIVGIDDQQLFDAVLVQQHLGLVLGDAIAYRDQLFKGHQFADGLGGMGGEAHIAMGEDAHQLADGATALAAILDHRDARDIVRLHQGQRIGQGRVRADGDGIDHHAALEGLDHAHLLGLFGSRQVLVDHAHAAGLGHGNRHGTLGNRIHGRAENGKIERYVLGDIGGNVGFRGQDVGARGLQQHVIEGERRVAGDGGNNLRQGQTFPAF